MKYYATLVGKETYAFNGNRFTKDERKEVPKGVYDAVIVSPLFITEVEDGFSSKVEEVSTVVSNEAMNIALAYSPNWSLHVKKQIYSIFKNNPPPVNIYLMSDEFGKIDADDICEYFGHGYTVKNVSVDKLYNKVLGNNKNVSSRFTKYTLYRLLIPMLLKVDRLLYIDSDALVTGDLTDMYHMDIEEALLAGVMDIGTAVGTVKKAINFEPNEIYINAGVTLMNLKAIREANLQEQWVKMCNEKFYYCHDQDILNITCRGKVKLISNKYNASLSTGVHSDDIRIAHYAGSKPWNNASRVPAALVKYWFDVTDEFNAIGFRKIPKRIFYCWFGGKEKPALVKECLESWKKHMPHYEIVEINETNFDCTQHGQYVKDAYAQKKWAFITDYVRLWALYHFGGIYMDSDVKAVRPLDRFLKEEAFTGHETSQLLITATMGAVPENRWIEYLLSYYRAIKFNTIPNTKTVSNMSRKLIRYNEPNYKELEYGVKIFPVEYFCSYDHKNLKLIPTNKAYTYHLFAGTWLGRTEV